MNPSTAQKRPPDIVCDNSVWYRLSDGRINWESVKDMRLISTFTNINELCTSANLIKNHEGYSQVWGALAALRLYNTAFWPHTPHELLKFKSGYATETVSWEVMEKVAFKILMNPVPDEETKLMLQDFITQQRDRSSRLTNLFMSDVRDYHRTMTSRAVLKKQLKALPVQDAYLSMCQRSLEIHLTDSLPIQWDRFELFIRTLNHWFYQLSIQDHLSMTDNDWVDIHNLIYVAPGNLYWTEDNLKTKAFIKQAGCGHYLYQHHSPVNGEA